MFLASFRHFADNSRAPLALSCKFSNERRFQPANFLRFPKGPGEGYGRFVGERGRRGMLDVSDGNFRYR